MIDGRGSGTGKYLYKKAYRGKTECQVTKMPEDCWNFRISFAQNGEIYNPIMRVSDTDAQLLWVCLKGIAEEFGWSDEVSK